MPEVTWKCRTHNPEGRWFKSSPRNERKCRSRGVSRDWRPSSLSRVANDLQTSGTIEQRTHVRRAAERPFRCEDQSRRIRPIGSSRYLRPAWADGECSVIPDTGPYWDATWPCQTHDYGYDLVRFGVADRVEVDDLLLDDLHSNCGRMDDAVGRVSCGAVA